ncbi:MAG: hypothetical protein ACKVP7_01990 [Hyphomicrobiaceae bacterium]
MSRLPPMLTLALITTGASLTPALANDINTGDPNGAYHSTFCPRVEGELKKARFAHTCKTSQGTAENIKRVLADPKQVGFGQLDILALEGVLSGTAPPITVMRRDDARECLFAVTRNKDVQSYGHLAANAAKLRFILPPEGSGSAATFKFLRSIDVEGLGKATQVTHAKDTDEAIRQALAADDTATLFVQFPDPDNARFKLVSEQGGHFVPVIDRAILRPQIGNEKIYFAQETQVANADWIKAGVKVVTACTPLAIFTGSPERITDAKALQDHKDLIATVRALKPEVLLPPEGTFARFWRRTRELSGSGTEELVKLSEEAREKALPYFERAKQATEKALEAAKPALDKAAEESKRLIEKAKEEAKDLLDKAKPAPAPAPAPAEKK